MVQTKLFKISVLQTSSVNRLLTYFLFCYKDYIRFLSIAAIKGNSIRVVLCFHGNFDLNDAHVNAIISSQSRHDYKVTADVILKKELSLKKNIQNNGQYG